MTYHPFLPSVDVTVWDLMKPYRLIFQNDWFLVNVKNSLVHGLPHIPDGSTSLFQVVGFENKTFLEEPNPVIRGAFDRVFEFSWDLGFKESFSKRSTGGSCFFLWHFVSLLFAEAPNLGATLQVWLWVTAEVGLLTSGITFSEVERGGEASSSWNPNVLFLWRVAKGTFKAKHAH